MVDGLEENHRVGGDVVVIAVRVRLGPSAQRTAGDGDSVGNAQEGDGAREGPLAASLLARALARTMDSPT